MGATGEKDNAGMILNIALVWFATHVGGSFASGASHFAYFIDYGIFCLALAPLSLAAIAFVYWWGWRHARIHGTYDYRTLNDSFYGKYAPVLSNLYEVLYRTAIDAGNFASACIACGRCEDVCPQNIEIISQLRECVIALEP